MAKGRVRVKSGDLWVLVDHRLLCGDSSQVEDVDRLLSQGLNARATIHLVNTDAPLLLRARSTESLCLARIDRADVLTTSAVIVISD